MIVHFPSSLVQTKQGTIQPVLLWMKTFFPSFLVEKKMMNSRANPTESDSGIGLFKQTPQLSATRRRVHLNEPRSTNNKASLILISPNNAKHNQAPSTNAAAGIGIEIYAHLNNTTMSIRQISQATIASPPRAHACSWFVYKTNLMYAFNTYLTYATHWQFMHGKD